MTRPFRFLGQASSSNATATDSFDSVTVNSDLVVILAALLCALICVLGLVAVARCAWLRRLSTSRAITSANASSSPETETASSTTPSSTVAAASLANKGLKKKILKSLPKFPFTAESAAKFSSSECAICLSEFAPGDEILVLPQCRHAFHVGCIETWLGSHSTCPSCRQILLVARCHKCGVPQAEARFKERVDDANRFLP
ncbi:hypothetical protein I3842_07G137700 [Carya illinoinensis]|uniref:RING-type domain-containing protein n=1 Tax=Carya illinoinensis TaxID=32201 RepID=A0A922EMC9_CARIL|nr:hypothetical protein I3842_07G137700 [Carya illinoinensis]